MTPNWERIKAHYRHNDMAIHQAGRSQWGIDPYAWDHEAGITLTPIENWLWSDIRAVGAVFYPQYPVGRRFVDFGNPCAKVAIECDGKQWHMDKDADAQRQHELERAGWTVYRFTGSQCRQDGGEYEDENGNARYRVSDTYLRIKEIAEAHGLRLWAPSRRVLEAA